MDIDALDARLRQHDIELERLNKIVIGNGHAGIITRIENIDARLSAMESAIARINSSITWIVRLVVASVIGQILTAVFRH